MSKKLNPRKKFLNFLLKTSLKGSFFLILFFSFFLKPNFAFAQSQCGFKTNPPSPMAHPPDITFSFDKEKVIEILKKYPQEGKLYWSFPDARLLSSCRNPLIAESKDIINDLSSKDITISANDLPQQGAMPSCPNALKSQGEHFVEIIYEYITADNQTRQEKICQGMYEVTEQESTCKLEIVTQGIGDINSKWEIFISEIKLDPQYNAIEIKVGETVIDRTFVDPDNPPNPIFREFSRAFKAGIYQVVVSAGLLIHNQFQKGPQMCTGELEIAELGSTPKPPKTPTPVPFPLRICNDPNRPKDNTKCNPPYHQCPDCPKPQKKAERQIELKSLCEQLSSPFSEACKGCQADGKHLWTALGCIPTDKWEEILKKYVFEMGIGIAGAIAFLYFLYGTFLILTSAGNPEKIEEGKQIMTSSLTGLLLIIFSVLLLKIIGVDILQLPGFS